jgi:glyoxylase-like metal-dependent hydrolase (beta-lactamase superfamily II)
MNPGFHMIKLGDFEITAIYDGMFSAPIDIVTGLALDEAAATMERNFRAVPPVLTICAYLVRHPGGLALVDTGSADKFGPGHGHLIGSMATLGFQPGEIDTILLTHAHVDHAGGMTGPDWQPLYPSAEVVLSAVEQNFWLNEAKPVSPKMERGIKLATGSLAPYRARTRTVQDGQEALPGMRLLALPGHTPGHSGWMLSSGGESLLIWGDVIHLPGLQMERPEATVVYDLDPSQAAASRARALDMAATDRFRVAGPHLDFPTFGYIERRAKGYGFVPDSWRP